MNAKSFKNLALVSELFIKNKLSVAVAESCTAGMIQNLISNAPEAMSFFQGGITVYNAGQKAKHLHINPIAAEKCNSVSKEIAEKLGYSTSQFISNWERGISQPPLNTLRKIAELYKINADEMFNVLLDATIAQVEVDLRRKFYSAVEMSL